MADTDTDTDTDSDNAFADPLAAVLWDARGRGAVVADARPWSQLSARRAAAISSELYRRQRARTPSAWKMGAFDAPTQERLVLDGALLAPVLADGLQVGVTEVRLELARFGQPKLEAEVGIRLTPQGNRLMPCVEIADCRFPDWAVPARAAVADFGLQGAMLFGRDTAPIPLVHVEVRRDGVPLQGADCTWDEAVGRLEIMPSSTRHNTYVATGAMTPLIPATRGRWEFDFGEAGSLTVVLY
jgi:2-keto-4-pentenoate hydratase